MYNFYNHFPRFNLGDIVLREIEPTQDAAAFYIYMNNSNVAPFLADCDRPKIIQDAINELNYWYSLFKYKRSIYWAIADAKDNTIIGTIGFNQYSETHRKVEISYDLDHNHWGKGIVTRSLKKIFEFSFQKMQLVRVQATVAIHNQRSINTLERLEFVKEGLMKNYCILEGKPIDYYLYAKFR